MVEKLQYDEIYTTKNIPEHGNGVSPRDKMRIFLPRLFFGTTTKIQTNQGLFEII